MPYAHRITAIYLKNSNKYRSLAWKHLMNILTLINTRIPFLSKKDQD